jgi:hypothetical protein
MREKSAMIKVLMQVIPFYLKVWIWWRKMPVSKLRLPFKFCWMKSWMFFFSPSLVGAATSHSGWQSQLTNKERYKSIKAEILGEEFYNELGSGSDEYDSEE